MILAGDIGGTKTNLGLFDLVEGALSPRHQQSFPSKNYSGLEAIIAEFTAGIKEQITAACFGVAGPVVAGRSETPNLAWDVDARGLGESLKLESVGLINDLEATAYGIAELKAQEFYTLNEGAREPGNAALIAAGTGLGMASLFWDGRALVPSASEGGHMDFAPRNPLEIGLLEYLLKEHSRVSVERVLSGPGLFNIYRFLRSGGHGEELPEIAARLAHEDPANVVATAALAGLCEMCVKALDMFVAIYGATAGNIALLLKATAGVYVGGGIAPKIIDKLKGRTFIQAFSDKGRLSPLVADVPVQVIMNDKTALLGAARVAARSV